MSKKYTDYIGLGDIDNMDETVRAMLTDIVRTLTKYQIKMVPVNGILGLLGVNASDFAGWDTAYLFINENDKLECEHVDNEKEIDLFNGYDVISTTLH